MTLQSCSPVITGGILAQALSAHIGLASELLNTRLTSSGGETAKHRCSARAAGHAG